MNRLHRGQKGFTLVELLVVIAILGILAAVAIPLLIGFIEEGRFEAASSELHHVQLAVTAAMADIGVGHLEGRILPATIPAVLNEGLDLRVICPMDNTVYAYVGDFITADVAALEGSYRVLRNGTVEITGFPGLAHADLPDPSGPPP